MELGRLLQQQCRDLDTIKEECNWIDYKTQHGTWFIVTGTIQITRHSMEHSILSQQRCRDQDTRMEQCNLVDCKTQHGTW